MRRGLNVQLIGIALLFFAPALSAQQPPAIHGLTGTIVTEQTGKDEHKAANKVVVATEDGARHMFDAAGDLVVHGGKDLADLKPGTTVVVHYTSGTAGEVAHEVDRIDVDGLRMIEGIVTSVDRAKKEIRVRYDNGTIEKLTLTARAAVDGGQDFRNVPTGTTRVVVYYSQEAGGKVAHYFKQKS